MLNIGKLGHGQHLYYLRSVAQGVEDYYTGSGEAPGYWRGGGAGVLGLAGTVDGEALHNTLDGRDPDTGENLLMRRLKARVPGWDCTFRAPKSVSLLYGLGTVDVSETVRRAHDESVHAAMDYLERTCATVRRGNGGTEVLASTGFVSALFRHRTSRAGDPLLHTHALTANMLQGADGNWSAIDGRLLYGMAKTAGYLYQAHLRDTLTRELGVSWTPVRNGLADVAGIPRATIRAFSKRREEIELRMEARAESSPKAAQVATLSTRRAKDYNVDGASLVGGWRARADALGLDADALEALLNTARARDASRGGLYEDLASPTGLTEHASTFLRRDAIRAICDRLPAGAPVTEVEALADEFLASADAVVVLAPAADAAEVIRRSDGTVVRASVERRYSTPEMLATEERLIDRAVHRAAVGLGVVEPEVLEAALARRAGGEFALSAEQVTMVRELTTSGRAVEVVVGKAGSGKTRALDTAREAWQAEGRAVIGAALSARAAAELQAGSGIASFTLDSLLMDLGASRARADEEGHTGPALAPGTVIVIDEAAMVGTRKLDRLLAHAEREEAKVVFVGDHHQVPEIDAGGAFRGMHHRLPAIELVQNHRQRHAWEREALDDLRIGESASAVSRYHAEGRITTGDDVVALRQVMLDDWWTSYEADDPVLMVALRAVDVDELNNLAHQRRVDAGMLGDTAVVVSRETATGLAVEREFREGDRVLLLHNNRRLGVRNGMYGTVIGVDPEAFAHPVRESAHPVRATRRVASDRDTAPMRIRTDDGTEVAVPRSYLRRHVAHGYAITGHKAQGVTTERCLVLGGEELYREWGYVALSRGRENNHLYVLAPQNPWAEEIDVPPLRELPDPILMASRALERSRAQHLAIEGGDTGDISAMDTLDLEKERAALHQALTANPCPPSADRDLDDVRNDIAAAEHTLAQGDGRVEGLARAERRSAAAQRRQWEARLVALQAREAELVEAQEAVQAWLEMNAGAIARYRVVAEELALRTNRTTRLMAIDPPTYIVALLGEAPGRPSQRMAWTRAVHAVERYRRRWGITDAAVALGPAPRDVVQRDDYRSTRRRLEAHMRRLEVHGREPTKVRSARR